MNRQEIVDVLKRGGAIEAQENVPGFAACITRGIGEVWYSDGWIGAPCPKGQLDRWAALFTAPYHVENGVLPNGAPCLRITRG